MTTSPLSPQPGIWGGWTRRPPAGWLRLAARRPLGSKVWGQGWASWVVWGGPATCLGSGTGQEAPCTGRMAGGSLVPGPEGRRRRRGSGRGGRCLYFVPPGRLPRAYCRRLERRPLPGQRPGTPCRQDRGQGISGTGWSSGSRPPQGSGDPLICSWEGVCPRPCSSSSNSNGSAQQQQWRRERREQWWRRRGQGRGQRQVSAAAWGGPVTPGRALNLSRKRSRGS